MNEIKNNKEAKQLSNERDPRASTRQLEESLGEQDSQTWQRDETTLPGFILKSAGHYPINNSHLPYLNLKSSMMKLITMMLNI